MEVFGYLGRERGGFAHGFGVVERCGDVWEHGAQPGVGDGDGSGFRFGFGFGFAGAVGGSTCPQVVEIEDGVCGVRACEVVADEEPEVVSPEGTVCPVYYEEAAGRLEWYGGRYSLMDGVEGVDRGYGVAFLPVGSVSLREAVSVEDKSHVEGVAPEGVGVATAACECGWRYGDGGLACLVEVGRGYGWCEVGI